MCIRDSCNTINNIPFYQRVYTRFSIKYHVICDTDDKAITNYDRKGNPMFESGIQKSICSLLNGNSSAGLLRVHNKTFEPAHKDDSVFGKLRLPEYPECDGKPFNANKYWKDILEQNYLIKEIYTVPIIKNVKEILGYKWDGK